MPADNEFYGSLSISSGGTEADHALRKDQIDALIAFAVNRVNHQGMQPHESITGLQALIDARIQNVIGAAPSALDTLAELATALGNDPNFATTVTSQLGALDGRVDQLEVAVGGGVGSVQLDIGDNVASSFPITHNLNGAVGVEVVRKADGQTVYPVIKRPGMSLTQITVDFGSFVPAANAFQVLIGKIG